MPLIHFVKTYEKWCEYNLGANVKVERIAVLGAGNAGHAAAADLTLAGYDVNLFEVPELRRSIEPILERGGIEIQGVAREGFAKVRLVTTNIKEAVQNADLIMITVPSSYHTKFAELCAPHLENGQIVVLNPGHTGGALEFAKKFRDLGVKTDIKIAETMTLTYVCRIVEPAKVKVFHVHKKILFSAFPSKDTWEAHDAFKELYPNTLAAKNVMETGLTNTGAILHPAGMVMNAGWIERTKGDFLFYVDGITPSVARVVEAVDAERMNLMRAFGLRPVSFPELYFEGGYTPVKASTTFEALQSTVADRQLRAPSFLTHRYVDEYVKCGLVPMVEIGDLIGVNVPTMKALIHLSCTMNNVNYWAEGRTLERMGVPRVDIASLNNWLETGCY